MAFVAFATTVGFGSAVLGTAIIGAGVGGAYSAITGDGNILNSMLTGALIGGAGAGLMTAAGAGGFGAATAAETATTATGLGAPGAAATVVNTTTPAMEAAALLDAAAVTEGGTTAGMAGQYATQEAAKLAAEEVAKKTAATGGMKMLGYGLAGTAAMQLLGDKKQGNLATASDPGNIRPYEYSAKPMMPDASGYATAQYDANGIPILDSRERTYFDQSYTPLTPYSAKVGTPNPNLITAASGGIMDSYRAGQFNNIADYDDESGSDSFGMANGGLPMYNMGGSPNLGDYSDGGRLLKGPGDGVSDSIPATIANKQPARLADGEFVIPARIVSEIGNGSTDAGAKRLYAMMDSIQEGRKKTIGKKNVAKDTKAKDKLLA